MGKKKSRASQTSKGIVGTKNSFISKQVRADRGEMQTHLDKLRAFRAGKNVWFTIPNPDKNATNRLFIRVKGKDLYGDWRKHNEYNGVW